MTGETQLTTPEVLAFLEEAFLPVRCKAITVDYENCIDLHLYAPDDSLILTVKGTNTKSLHHRAALNELCERVRLQLVRRGTRRK